MIQGTKQAWLHGAGEAPLHHQLYMQLREGIRTRRYAPGIRMPSEVALCQAFGISRVTVRKAMERLVAEGCIVRSRGRGTVVTDVARSSGMSELLQNVEAVMDSTTGHLLEYGPSDAFGDVAGALHVADGTSVFRVVQVRLRDGQPMGLIRSWMPARFERLIDRAEAVRTPAVVILKRAGVLIGPVDQTIRAAISDADSGPLLDVPAGFPLLRLDRTIHDKAGAPLEHLAALYRADHYAVRMSLSPSSDGREHWSVHKFE